MASEYQIEVTVIQDSQVRKIHSLLTLSCVATTEILLLLFDGKTHAGQCLRPGARSRIDEEMTTIRVQIDGLVRRVYNLRKDLDEAQRVASKTFLFSFESTLAVTLAQFVTIPKLNAEIEYGQNLIDQHWKHWNRYNDYLKLPDCEQSPPTPPPVHDRTPPRPRIPTPSCVEFGIPNDESVPHVCQNLTGTEQ